MRANLHCKPNTYSLESRATITTLLPINLSQFIQLIHPSSPASKNTSTTTSTPADTRHQTLTATSNKSASDGRSRGCNILTTTITIIKSEPGNRQQQQSSHGHSPKPKKRNTTEITPFVGKNYPHLHPRTDTTREKKVWSPPAPSSPPRGGYSRHVARLASPTVFFSPRWALLRALRLPHQSNCPPLLSAVSSLHALSDRHLVPAWYDLHKHASGMHAPPGSAVWAAPQGILRRGMIVV